MVQNMKLSIVAENNESFLVEVNSHETFEEFQQKILKEHNLCITIADFQMFFENLRASDNLFNCVKENLNIGDDIINLENPPIYEINLNRDIQTEYDKSSITNDGASETIDEVQNLDPSLIVLNEEHNTEYTILDENIFDSSDFDSNRKQQLTLYSDSNVSSKLDNVANHTQQNSTNPKEAITSNETFSYMDIESKLAEMHSNQEKNFYDLCRLCAQDIPVGGKIEINNKYYLDENLEDKINSLLPICISKEDGLPQQICITCIDQLSNYHKFVEIVIGADKKLRLKFLKEKEKIPQVSESITKKFKTPSSKSKSMEQDAEIENDFEVEYLDTESNTRTDDLTQNCRFCNLIIGNVDKAIEHATIEHRIDNLYVCIFCELGFHKTSLLEIHLKMEHRKLFIKQHQCKNCSMKFTTQILLSQHTCKKNVNNKTLSCEICNSSFATEARLNFHKKFHLKDSHPLFCADCKVSFESENELYNHVNLKHNKDENVSQSCKCEICDELFIDEQTLKNHEATHSSKPFQCHICGKSMSKKSRLRRHLLTHESNPVVSDVIVCDICKEAFTDAGSAAFHKMCQHSTRRTCIKVIYTDKVYKCEFCEKCYYTPEALNEHRGGHAGPTPFSCSICNEQFSSYSRCATHKTTHGICKDGSANSFSVDQHFLCEHCGKSYLQSTYLALHRRLKHSETAQAYKCTDCKLQFPNSWGLAHHKKLKHNLEHTKCFECNKVLANEHCLKLHLLAKHPSKKANQCVICGKIFQYQTSLEAHMKVHKELKEFKCILCPKIFLNLGALTTHFVEHKNRKHIFPNDPNTCLYTHTDRPFTCDVCGLAFRKQFTLKNHKLKHVETSAEGSFVLMVDMKEDDQIAQNGAETEEQIPQLVDSGNQQEDVNFSEANITPNYIDIGNGNFLQLQGNTFNLEGQEYVLVDEKSNNQNPELEMVVDETVQNEEMNGNINTGSTLICIANTGIVNRSEIPPEFFDDRKMTLPGTTYIIDGNEYLLQEDEQTF